MSMLEVRDLKAYFHTAEGIVTAVDGVSFTVEPGETLGIVGESGSGKTATALSIMQLNPKRRTRYPDGEILFEGRDLLTAGVRELNRVRGNDIAMIFQDPTTSLNPVFTIGEQISEAVRIHQGLPKKQARERAIELLADVGIPRPRERARNYPHQFSGGMCQRVMIAMALSCNPKVLIADEPTTALDVTIQAQILELIVDLQDKYETAVIIITHDLGIVARLADRVAVMYAGRIVEEARTEALFRDPLMPYTWSLLRSIPQLDVDVSRLRTIKGQPPSLMSPPRGCSFSPRCTFAMDECHDSDPLLEEKRPGHLAACIMTPDEFERRRSAVDDEYEVAR